MSDPDPKSTMQRIVGRVQSAFAAGRQRTFTVQYSDFETGTRLAHTDSVKAAKDDQALELAEKAAKKRGLSVQWAHVWPGNRVEVETRHTATPTTDKK